MVFIGLQIHQNLSGTTTLLLFFHLINLKLFRIPDAQNLLKPANIPWIPTSPGCPPLPHRLGKYVTRSQEELEKLIKSHNIVIRYIIFATSVCR